MLVRKILGERRRWRERGVRVRSSYAHVALGQDLMKVKGALGDLMIPNFKAKRFNMSSQKVSKFVLKVLGL